MGLIGLGGCWLPGCGGAPPPRDLASAPFVTITVRNASPVLCHLPANATPTSGWLTIEGHESWLYAEAYTLGRICERVPPQDVGVLPPPDTDLPSGQSFVYPWKTNAFEGSGSVGGLPCMHLVRVPEGQYQARICARLRTVSCSVAPLDSDFGPVCHRVPILVSDHDTTAETSFTSVDFPDNLCAVDRGAPPSSDAGGP